MQKDFIIITSLLISSTFAVGPDHYAEIKSQTFDARPDGSYEFGFDTSNGISVHESGDALHKTGSASWYAPDGQPLSFAYLANDNGFQVQADHLPTPPPTPSHVLRALEYIRLHPSPENELGSYDRKYHR